MHLSNRLHWFGIDAARQFEIASEVEYLWVLALKEECGLLADS